MSSIYDKMTDTEKEVADYFQEMDLRWVFQFPVFLYDENDRPRLFSPDFYIPKLGLFIEVCGSEEFDYEYRKKIYEKNGIPVVFLHYYKNPRKWKSFLANRVAKIEQQREIEAQKLTGFSE
jgi:hypothetical protein